ncbi:MAG: hypothetical protein AAF988_07050 [Pseudomonadota bacterium]
MGVSSNYQNTVRRVIPGLNAESRIVCMPSWAWFWLDDFVENFSPGGYEGLYEAFGDAISSENLTDSLHNIATLHQDFCLREIYHLANDDLPSEAEVEQKITAVIPVRKKPKSRMPKIYKLFGFMPCPTTLDAVWERQHYHKNKLFDYFLQGDEYEF